ncbi:transposase mutator type [Sulfolobus islandicus M.14.25]|uniref:Transposase mutator type n=1 Tax=Saccharolobus islandicus (strain M.14.25 / Kamchatka \|nr:IS256 family transposase [Sulfolobus islandicus]ACP39241.1 transposase mutator type [Sulfolobus islandicus M.14.25]
MTKSKNNPGRGNTIRESNTMKVMEEIREKIRKAIKEGISLREIEEIILQEAMMEEREAYLEVEDDHKNGTLLQISGNRRLSIKTQSTENQKGWLQTQNPSRERTSPDYEDFLQQLVLSGMTPSQVKAVLAAKGIPYSEIVMDRVAERISNKLKEYKNRELPHDLLALYIDVKIVKVRINESIMERAIYIAIGVDLEGNKFVLDYEVRDREDLDGWKSFLGGLVSRGVSRVDVIVSDDFSGLDRVVSTLFPSSQHQLCITHMVRNLMRVLPDKEKEELMIRVRDLKSSRNVEEGRKAISSLSQLVQPFSPARAKRLLDAADKYCSFLNFPREVRHYLYTNNTSESFNSTLARFEEELGGYFPSLRSLEVYLYVSIHESNSRWKFRPMWVIRHYSYHLKQLHASRFQVSLDEDF